MDWDRVLSESIAGLYLGIRLSVAAAVLLMIATCAFIVLAVIGGVARAVAWMLI